MALSNNPNKTRSIEKAWNREISRKFRELNTFMLNLPLSSLTVNITAAQQLEINAFMAQFKEAAINLFLSIPWQNKYQTEAYERGIERADQEIKAALTAAEAAALPTLNIPAAALVTTTVHSAELEFLHDRANVKLEKWIDELLFDTRSILHEQMGIVSVDDIHDAITDRINATTSRARVIAVTEISQASQKSVIKEGESINAQGGVQVEAQWITVRDSRVRHLHANWHRVIMSLAQAARNITISPWNCRCGLKLVVRNRQSARVTAIYAKERKQLLSNETQAA